jgi:hypothetical protein
MTHELDQIERDAAAATAFLESLKGSAAQHSMTGAELARAVEACRAESLGAMSRVAAALENHAKRTAKAAAQAVEERLRRECTEAIGKAVQALQAEISALRDSMPSGVLGRLSELADQVEASKAQRSAMASQLIEKELEGLLR